MVLKLVAAIDRSRIAPSVVSLKEIGTIGKHIQALGVPVYGLDMARGWPNLTAIWRLRALGEKLRPDIVQGWMYHGNLAATLLAKMRGTIPVVWSIRQSLYDIGKERPLTRAVIRANAALSAIPKRIIYNSQTSLKQHVKFGFKNDHAVVVPNGFDLAQFRPDAQTRYHIQAELGISPQAVLIGLVSRYHPMKDHATFLRAAAILVQHVAHVRFLMLGHGVRQLSSLVASLNLADSVLLLDEREDIPDLTSALDIACSSSAWGEGFSNAVGEAMACGVPCVVTDVGDSALIVGDTGRVVPPKDPRALASAIIDMIDIGQEGRARLGAAARCRIAERYELSQVVRQYQDNYEEILSNVRHRRAV